MWDELKSLAANIPLLMALFGGINKCLQSFDNIIKSIGNLFEKRKECVKEERLLLVEKSRLKEKNAENNAKLLRELSKAITWTAILGVVFIVGYLIISAPGKSRETSKIAAEDREKISEVQPELSEGMEPSIEPKVPLYSKDENDE